MIARYALIVAFLAAASNHYAEASGVTSRLQIQVSELFEVIIAMMRYFYCGESFFLNLRTTRTRDVSFVPGGK
jgi:hypothetical protein